MTQDLSRAAEAAFPDDPNPLVAFAHLKTRDHAFDDAAVLWGAIRTSEPGNMPAYLWGAFYHREQGQFVLAEEILQAALSRFPAHTDLLFDLARLATHRGATEQARARWRLARAFAPARYEGWIGEARARRDAGDLTGAQRVLEEARRRFPDEWSVLAELGHLHMRTSMWDEAAAIWADLREQRSDVATGFSAGAATLRHLGRLDEASALLDHALSAFPGQTDCWMEAALTARQRGDAAQALEFASEMRRRFPQQNLGYFFAATWLAEQGRTTEAEALLAAAEQMLADSRAVAVERAKLAMLRRDWADATRRWRAVRSANPSDLQAFHFEALCLRRQRRFGEAGDVLTEALALGETSELLAEAGWNAYDTAELDKAVQLFSECRSRYPDRREGYIGLGQTLLELRRRDDAEETFQLGVRELPSDAGMFMHFALAPRQDSKPGTQGWERSLARFAELRTRFPNFSIGFLESMRTLRVGRQIEEAERVGKEAVARFPNDPEIGVEYASAALDREDWTETETRFRALASRFPDLAAGPAGLARALAGRGRLAEAEDTLRAALLRWPSERGVLVGYAELAMRRGDWAEAVQRWQAAADHHPHDRVVKEGLFGARTSAGADAEAGASTGQYRDLMLGFESLAGTLRGCEFGLVQCHFGAEPLGLLRWSVIKTDNLALALENGFEGIGRSENTNLYALEDSSREYIVHDRRYGTVMHTFVSSETVPFETMRSQMIVRSAYLRRKLIEDLTEGEKIFVYRTPERTLSLPELRRIRAGMARYGDNTLLYVRLADDDHPPGTAAWQEPGLMVGFIDRFEVAADGSVTGSNFPGWLAVCQSARRLMQESPQMTAESQPKAAAFA